MTITAMNPYIYKNNGNDHKYLPKDLHFWATAPQGHVHLWIILCGKVTTVAIKTCCMQDFCLLGEYSPR